MKDAATNLVQFDR